MEIDTVKLILSDVESRIFWVKQFGEYDEFNYKESEFYKHDYALFHVERSYNEWVSLTAWAVHNYAWNKRLEIEFRKVAPTHSLLVDGLVKRITELTTIIGEINK